MLDWFQEIASNDRPSPWVARRVANEIGIGRVLSNYVPAFCRNVPENGPSNRLIDADDPLRNFDHRGKRLFPLRIILAIRFTSNY